MVNIKADQSYRIYKASVESELIKSVGWSKGAASYIISIQTNDPDFSCDVFLLSDPHRLVLDVQKGENGDGKNDLSPKRETPPENRDSNGKSSSFSSSQPQSTQKTIVIDPGHGGLETGAHGENGASEKDVTLDISLRLRDIIRRNLAYRVVLTREEDVNIPLTSRAAIANSNDAFLFLSIHANSSFRQEARGSEVYFLSLNATDEEARRLAYLENHSSEMEGEIKEENQDDIEMILWDMAQTAYLKQSSVLAESIQKELNALLGTSHRGIKQAPFKVLKGVACPAVLVEVAFISNPEEEKKLIKERFQKKVAESIYKGLVSYLRRESQ
ncbi:N-acetylmuramoyl-L-alanine amidase [bacterium]|nr:N-acetylmuramoyl-L-alanine amidase [bacterium]